MTNKMETKFFPDMPEDEYHSDPFDVPTLSSSMAARLITGTPLEVWTESSRLNPDFEKRESEAMEKGKLLDALILQGENIAEILDFPDYRTAAAKDAREDARSTGRVPVLKKNWQEIHDIRTSLFRQLAQHEEHGDALRGGIYQASVFWQDGNVAHRCRFDHVNPENGWIDDLKTTGLSIDQWIKNMFAASKDIQAPLYERGYEAWQGVKPRGFRFVVVETKKPYLASVVMLDTMAMEFSVHKLEHARRIWADCLYSGDWYGYPRRTLYASPPSWVEQDFQNKIFNHEAMQPAPEQPKEKIRSPHEYFGM